MDVLDKSQAFVALSEVYENEEVKVILDTADSGTVFTDELFIPGSSGLGRMEVSVRREPSGYIITWK